MLTVATREAYADLTAAERIELSGTTETLTDVRFALPPRSLLAGYLDDFLPGNQSQHLDAKLHRDAAGNWQLSIRVPSLDETGEFYFTAAGESVRNPWAW